MAKPVPYNQWISDRSSKVIAFLKQAGNNPDFHVMYNLRQELKRIKAAYKWSAAPNDESFSKAFPTVHRLFKLGGKIRITDMVSKRLLSMPAGSNNRDLNNALLALKTEAEKNWDRFIKKRTTANAFTQEVGLWANFCKAKPLARVKKLINSNAAMATAKLPTSRDAWHDHRKHLKRWLFSLETPVYDHKSLTTAQMENLALLQQQIGDWHDWQDAEYVLEKIRKKLNPGDFFVLKQQLNTAITMAAKVIIRQSAGM